jgi:DNA-directed RNA polymerase subunit RPC12/RpoP
VKKKTISASVFIDPTEIVTHLVGLKDVRVLSYVRRGPAGELTIEQIVQDPTCPRCGKRVRVKERPLVDYSDLPFGGVPMTLRWKKHRLVCVNPNCAVASYTLGDHRLAAKGVMLTTRAAKWVVKEICSGERLAPREGTALQLGQREHRDARLRRGATGGGHQAAERDDRHWS